MTTALLIIDVQQVIQHESGDGLLGYGTAGWQLAEGLANITSFGPRVRVVSAADLQIGA